MAVLDWPWGGSSDDDSTTTTDDSSTPQEQYEDSDPSNTTNDSDPFIPSSLADLGFPDLGKYADTLVAIAKNPTSFVLGALIAALLSGILDIARVFYNGINLALLGSGIGYTEGETIGIEDLFYISWDIISGAGSAAGQPILDFIGNLQATLTVLAEGTGVFAFPVTVASVALMIGVSYIVLTRVGRATLAAIPLVGPFLEALIFE